MCCYKNRIRVAIFKLNGKRISDEFACKLCIGLFILDLIKTDIILRSNLTYFLLYVFFGSYVSLPTIAFLGFAINTHLLISLYWEIKHLIKTVNCKCIEYVNANDAMLHDHTD